MPKLFDSIKIKNIKIKNRIVLPPLVRFSMVGKDGFVTDRVVEWYRDVCAGGIAQTHCLVSFISLGKVSAIVSSNTASAPFFPIPPLIL